MTAPDHPAAPPAAAGFDDPSFGRLAALIYREAGIVLGPEKTSMMRARLTKRLAASGAPDLDAYLRLVDGGKRDDELANLVSALTTNVTHFFRESHHFDFLRQTVFSDPSLRGRLPRIWSAGCSSGQEPYSIAMTAQSCDARATITATDVDRQILARAERAIYADAEIGGVPLHLRAAAFDRVPEGWRIRPALRAMVSFQPLNLHAFWPFDGPFDAIFCRNVIIYFDPAAQMRLWSRFCTQLRPGGLLFIGHSERIPDTMRGVLRPVGHTIYRYLPS
ncbi:CheR family methyltransferase [Paracoccus luteus]|uniref:CheR family methyltransferase n=1 Tax=Paracoccus luteus TaxID=2508543 RepID=UPI00106F99EF|nr:CheR family methyltransferase [Paracoccus luteus]